MVVESEFLFSDLMNLSYLLNLVKSYQNKLSDWMGGKYIKTYI